MEQRKYPFSWEPGWSYSRMNTLRICLRLYWYEYYAKRFAPPAERCLIMELKGLSRVPFQVGNAVHQTIADLLEFLRATGRMPELEDAREMAISKFAVLLSNSPLVEARLGVQFTGEDREAAHDVIRTSMNTFHASKWLEMLREADADARKEWHVDPPGFGEFRLEGKKAYAKPDLMFRHDGMDYLLEWKTGKPHREQNQLQVQAYLFYAKDIMVLDLETMVGVVHYLSHPEEKPMVMTGRDLDADAVKAHIMDDIRLIESLCEDVATNTPRPFGHFVRTEALGYCTLCNYREICRPNFVNENI